ncbi:FAD-dependent oxidoreductase [Kibdelosporangium persicum]|uniref:Flavin-dependent amine oxidoreductase n=1 Tax=Kibdelosporangium persicum TaxID=2698649 RepID=A0ABX2FC38_9PSEU|nr:FAD-dependent oxidoreductase [Kibdelosporangium persicum]NRN68950.1 Flavin-dependent amine oxidoreductase [Kibdelosporangium persicum]
MNLSRKQLLKAMAGAGAAAVVGPLPANASGSRVIERDVCVLGGGASGSYAAVRLRDLGRSVVLVERKDRLGGHTETFHDPVSGGTADIGVVAWYDFPVVRDLFGRFDVPLRTPPAAVGTIRFADFRTGQVVDNYLMPPVGRMAEYAEVLEQYPYLDDGMDLPDPVPHELLAPFRDVMVKHGLSDMAPFLALHSQGRGDLFDQPAIYMMKYLNLPSVRATLTGTALTTSRRDNSELYEKITTHLGGDVLLDARLTAVQRDGAGVRVQAGTPQGPRTIRARKLVVTVPPLLGNLAPFDLDSTERAVFSRWRPGGYYTSVLRLPGVPQVPIQNISADTARFHMPSMPGIYILAPTGIPDIFIAYYGSAQPLPDAHVRADIVAALDRLQNTGVIPATRPRFEMFSSHAPFLISVSARDIANGFYRRLNALQGHNSTFYSGAAFHTNDSTLLWRFTERLLPRI